MIKPIFVHTYTDAASARSGSGMNALAGPTAGLKWELRGSWRHLESCSAITVEYVGVVHNIRLVSE